MLLGNKSNVDISGPNGRFNLHSQDLSVNLVDVNPAELFKKLRGVLAQEVEDDDKRDLLLRRVTDLKNEQGKSGFVDAYKAFVSAAADHMTVIAPFIPALAQLLPA